MAKTSLSSLLSKHLGNHRRINDVLQATSFPGLSIDNVPSTSAGVLGGVIGQVSSGAAGQADQQIASFGAQLKDLKATQQNQIDKLIENTKSLQQNTAAKSSSSSSSSGGIGGFAASLLGGSFGLSPIFQGILDLFGGSSTKTAQPLTPFTLPPSIQYAAGVNPSNGSLTSLDYGQNGQLRPVSAPASKAQVSPMVQIQVNAMDTQSFLDRSDDIAQAVRLALLNSNSLGDVIADL